jgi:photosystem II stability/assembly factor-like uncharacterized protein
MIRSLLVIATIVPAGAVLGSPERVVLAEELSHIHGVTFNATGDIVLATHAGIYRLDDDGRATQVSGENSDFMGISSVPGAATILASGHPQGGGNLGVIGSDDGGISWEPISAGASGPVDFHAMTVATQEPNTAFGVYRGALQVSTNGGVDWQWIGPAPEATLDIAAVTGQTVYAATAEGLWWSSDGGASWLPEQGGLARYPVTLVVSSPPRLLAFAAGIGLMARSGANGDWLLLPHDFEDTFLLHLAVAPENAQQMVAVDSKGALLVSEDGGRSWQPL